ncbi:dihydrolipoyllysine-residue acetyltransferase component 3 of pyruvate dehydrogenase complex, mitochondrial-like [Phragmites australis]|uniref:dihydrolipoyllysine-residue acetyltransferase component 3 of pyruvate dehydrogenase complex, mitochondrial-like n=1 Tax=Phragmites australis TaxID=29695 RepID=UPI002D76D596|nr:dihydrolipoyllysine-residue acetyltransferase component 3 of pyruvate dehydrogenase complex, mitochondrial-like [Phragmites australis]
MGGLTVFSDGVQNLIEKGYRKISPFFIPYAITNMGSALLAMDVQSLQCLPLVECFVMESLEHAMKRDAPIIAEYLGGAVNCDVYHMTDPRSHGLGDADKKGVGIIAEEVKQLAQRAKENSLKAADYEGGTFTVSNLGGPFGIKQFCAIINPPQSAILAICFAEKRVIPSGTDAQYEFGSFMSATLSCAIGAEFLKVLKGYIENPTLILL